MPPFLQPASRTRPVSGLGHASGRRSFWYVTAPPPSLPEPACVCAICHIYCSVCCVCVERTANSRRKYTVLQAESKWRGCVCETGETNQYIFNIRFASRILFDENSFCYWIEGLIRSAVAVAFASWNAPFCFFVFDNFVPELYLTFFVTSEMRGSFNEICV